MYETERTRPATANLYALREGSAPRRTSNALTLTTDTAGILDVFAQVFAQMSTPDIPSPPPPVASDTAASTSDSSAEQQARPDDRKLDQPLVVKKLEEPSDAARDALAQALVQASQPVQATHSNEHSNERSVTAAVEQASVDDVPTAPTVPTTQQLADATPANNAPVTVDEAPLGTSPTAVEPGTQPIPSQPEQPTADPSRTSSEKTVTATAEVVRPVSSEGETVSAQPAAEDTVDVSADTPVDTREQDSDPRRSSRRDHRNRDRSSASEPAKLERAAVKPVDDALPPATAIDAAVPDTSAELPPPQTNTTTGASSSVLPSTAGPASTVAGAAAASSIVTAKTSAGERASASDVTLSATSGSSASTARSSGAEKAGTGKSQSASDAVTRAKLVQRVSRAFQHLGNDGGTIRLRLAPAELGSVRVSMQIQGRKVNARVVAETEAASTILRDHLADLRSRLESQGMQVESFEIETDESSFGTANDSFGHTGGNPYQESTRDERNRTPPAIARAPVSHPVSRTQQQHDPRLQTSGVDIRF